jgi:transcriptional regulator with XRE-family HTH domain
VQLIGSEAGVEALRTARRALGDVLAQDGLSPLAAARLKAGLSQDDVYRRTGIMQPQLSRLENGRTPQPSAGTIEMLAAAYILSMEEVMTALRLTVQRTVEP